MVGRFLSLPSREIGWRWSSEENKNFNDCPLHGKELKWWAGLEHGPCAARDTPTGRQCMRLLPCYCSMRISHSAFDTNNLNISIVTFLSLEDLSYPFIKYLTAYPGYNTSYHLYCLRNRTLWRLTSHRKTRWTVNCPLVIDILILHT